MPGQEAGSEARRLEALWSGEFGDQYVARNSEAGAARDAFWTEHLRRFPARRVLEVGCNVGANLRCLAGLVPTGDLWGVDVNPRALDLLHRRLPGVNGGWAVARDLPFRDGWFDLVFTVAVLIHQPETTLPLVVAELVRCSRRYISCIEYTAPSTLEVNYRGQTGAFFKRDYRTMISDLFPELTLVHGSEVTKADGFDDGLGYFVWDKEAALG